MGTVSPFSLLPSFFMGALTLSSTYILQPFLRSTVSLCSLRVSPIRRFSNGCRFLSFSTGGTGAAVDGVEDRSLNFLVKSFPIPGAREALLDFTTGKRKATDVTHSVWKNLVHGGDTVVDATCGNGYDTVALVRLIIDGSSRGCVFGLDIQNSALENTSSLLKESVDEDQWDLVKLSLLCHSRMEDIVPKDAPVSLIAFNLGYLPGGNKSIITKPHTTLLALQAASRILKSGGLISIVAYVGHFGGREEFETVLSFTSNLPVQSWTTFKFETVNRKTGPVLLFIIKK